MQLILLVSLLFGCSKDQQQPEIEDSELIGHWTGAIQLPDVPLHVQLTFRNDEKWTGLLSIPAQGLNDYPATSVSLKSTDEIVVLLNLSGQQVTFEGKYDEGKIAGSFRQGGQSFPFKLTKSVISSEQNEPGEFLSIETAIKTLYGELAQPDIDEPHPIVLIIPGSGPTDRNGNTLMGENNSLKYLAEQLAENGIASLRFDKRGAGKNATAINNEEDFRFEQYVADAIQWVELLQRDERFSNVGIIGHSEGSLVGMLAAQQADVHTFVSLAGAGRTIDEVMYDQLADQLSDDLLEKSEHLLTQIKQGQVTDDIPNELASVFPESTLPFLTSWMQYDPSEELQKLSQPVLIVNGVNDLQVPASEADLLHEAASHTELLIIEKMNHVLKESPESRQENYMTYSNPSLPLAEGLIEGIMTFFDENQFSN